MSKYIIELGDSAKKVVAIYLDEGAVWTGVQVVEDLEILNTDYINEHYGNLQDEAYQRGLDDAWEAARKIAEMWETIDNDDLLEIFGVTARIGESTIGALFEKQTASEAIAKLKAYEEKQKADDEIKVGDEVTHKSDSVVWKAVCIQIDGDGRHMNLMGHTGAVGYYPVEDFKKTGRHFDIASILEDMRND